MKKALIAVDGTIHSLAVMSTYYSLDAKPDEVVFLHVENPGGKSLMYGMLGESEMSTLKESLDGTEFKDNLDTKADIILSYYSRKMDLGSRTRVRTIKRFGNPAEEILKAADEEDVNLIITGFSGTSVIGRLISGSVNSEVLKKAKVPVLVARDPLICEAPYTWNDAYAAMAVCGAVVLSLFVMGLFV